jgi:hypothetical protein
MDVIEENFDVLMSPPFETDLNYIDKFKHSARYHRESNLKESSRIKEVPTHI